MSAQQTEAPAPAASDQAAGTADIVLAVIFWMVAALTMPTLLLVLAQSAATDAPAPGSLAARAGQAVFVLSLPGVPAVFLAGLFTFFQMIVVIVKKSRAPLRMAGIVAGASFGFVVIMALLQVVALS